jgi:hypothetical protein
MIFPSVDDARAAADRLASSGRDVEASGDEWIVADPWGTRLRLATR